MTKFLIRTLFLSVFLLISSIIQAQSVIGKVSDSGGPLPGVNVVIQNSKIGVVTDYDGKFTLTNLPKDAVLVVSYLGYITQNIVVNGKTTINIVLVASKVDLQEVVVGYGSVKKKDLTGAIATVSSKEFEGKANSQFGNALEGKVAGVQVIRPSGQPQAGVSIRIRGTSTITAGSEPLYIVDGVTTTSINDISPSDIETMTILKDASSAAIYGSNGSNGVVLITTKRGGNQKTKVTFSTYTGFSSVTKKIDALNSEQYKSLLTDMGKTLDWSLYPYDTNWQDKSLRTAKTTNYQFGVSGGDEKTNFYISGTYLTQEGVILTNELERYTYKLNLDHKVSKSLKVGTSLSYSKSKDVDVNEGGKYGPIISMVTGAPITDVYDQDGKFSLNPFYNDLENPMGLLLANEHSYKNYRINGNIYAEISFLKYLKFRSMLGFEQINGTYNSWVNPYSSKEGRTYKGMASLSNSQTTYWTTENTLAFNKSFGKHNLSALIGYVVAEKDYSSSSIDAKNFGSGAIHTVNAGSIKTDSYDESKGRNLSYLARLNYNFEDKYLLTANFRSDGYSGFGELNKWGYFPSFSGGWRISKENFFNNVPVLTDVKLRAGWGEVGNGQVGNFAHYGLVNPASPYVIGGSIVTGTNPTTLESNNLKWETTAQTNFGIDISLLKDRLTLSSDYYIKKTRDMLLEKRVPASVGYTTALLNVGAVENKGFEFQVSSKNLVNELKWSTDFNISFNKSKILSLPGGSIKLGNISDRGLVSIAQEGQPLGTFYGYISDGVDSATGDIKYRDLDGSGDLSDGDQTIIGNSNPKFNYGLTNDFAYKNWSLNIFFQGVQGNQIFNATKIETESMFTPLNQSTAVLNRWTTPGQITDVPRATFGDTYNSMISSRYIEDGSYLRLKFVTLGYNLSSSLMKKLKMNEVKIYVTGSNLLTFTKYSGLDPEVSIYGQSGDNSMKNIAAGVDYGSYPQTREIILGVNLSF